MSFLYLCPGGGDAVYSVFVMTATLVEELCLGSLKGGDRFCTRGQAGCSTKSHLAKKLPVLPDRLYIAGRNCAYASPSLQLAKLSDIQVRRLLGEQHSVQQWTQLFHVLNGYDEKLEEGETDAVVKQVLEAGETVAVGKTPKRRRIKFGDVAEGSGLRGRAFALTPLGSLSEEDDQISRITAQCDTLVGQVSNLTQGEENTKRLLCSELDEFGVQLRALEASIGRDTAIEPSSSLWGGIAELREDVKDHEEIIGNMSDELVAAQLDIESSEEERKKAALETSELRAAHEELAELTAFISSEQESMVSELESLKKATMSSGGVRAGVVAGSSAATMLWRRESELLRAQIANVESELGSRLNAVEHTVGVKLEAISRRLEESGEDRGAGIGGSLDGEMRALKEKFKILEARVSSKPVVIGGKVFASYPDVHKFVVEKVPPNIYFLFHDPVTLLESISDAYTSKKDVMTEMHQGQKVGFSNEAEATIVASFKVLLPTVFSRAKDGSVPTASGTKHLPAVTSYLAWNPHDGITGVKQYIEKGTDDLRSTVGNDIDSFFVDHPDARMLATELLSLTCGFLGDKCNWIDTFFHELVNLSGVTKEEAWQLISACIKKMFEDFRTVRSPAANASSDKVESAKCAKYLWAVLQVHDIMREYREKRFRGHPSIAPVVNFHVFQTRVTKVAFDELNARLVSLANKFSGLDSLQGRVAKLEKK